MMIKDLGILARRKSDTLKHCEKYDQAFTQLTSLVSEYVTDVFNNHVTSTMASAILRCMTRSFLDSSVEMEFLVSDENSYLSHYPSTICYATAVDFKSYK